MLVLLPGLLVAQSRQDVANLIQDVDILKRNVAQMSYEVAELRRANATLQQRLAAVESMSEELVVKLADARTRSEARLAEMRDQIEKATEKQKDQIIANVSAQIEQFAGETQRAFEQLQEVAAPGSDTAAPGVKQSFGTDFPKNGVKYTVKKGDNLWKIAQELNSKVSWIQDANKIAKPSQIMIGQVLFIPQR